ncbi:facilitated trehalose transporter Tret1-like isoform X2 [Leptopilina boulardi]|uniref:facilitated trehalose transporter Tret1-like isoform X1 n=1 Tax=Leptopilina boulardi TaxID=63433 RepID=UPI0021F5C111|nr:facilitated trehalose transporter Tret1-like isoform X1 [Leptopilina boulardi]XP_051171607.1 facilitated trehalose transporter Tret1-like isoform X2 [Leptopilina boulardi]
MIRTKKEDYSLVIVFQYVAGITSTLIALGYNSVLSWMSPALPYLTSDKANSPLLATDFDLIATASTLGSFFGYLANPPLVKYFGTKWTLLIFAIPQIISWIMLVINEEFTTIWISRLISGLSYCGALGSLTEYLTAISNSGNRSKLYAIMNLSSNFGTLLPLALSLFLTYFQMNLSLMMIPIIFFVVFLFMPKSSYFVEMNKWKEEMKNNLEITSQKVNINKSDEKNFAINDKISIIENNGNILVPRDVIGNGDLDKKKNFQTEIKMPESDNILRNHFILNKPTLIDDKAKEKKNWSKIYFSNICHEKIKESSFWKLFMERNNRKSLFILMCVCCLDILAGHIPIVSYTEQFLTYPGSIMDGGKASFLMTIIKVIVILISTQYVEKIGKKKLLLICGIVGSCSMILVGLFFFFHSQNYDISTIGWFPLVFITISEIANALSVGNTYYAYQGELFSNDVKTLGISITNTMYMIIQLIALMKFQVLLQILGLYVIFWFFAFMYILMTLVIFIVGPETQGKTLQEIQMELKK